MALPATSVFEVRSVGNDTNGGAFDSTGTGTDFSQQNSKNTVGSNISVTDLVTAGTTTITSITAAFTTAINGNIVYITGGTGSITAGWYRLTFVNSTTCTTDRSTGLSAGTGATMNVGGALATPAQANTNAQAHNTVYVKATANYTFTTTLTINLDSRSGAPFLWIGYTTTRTDGGRATFTSSTNSVDIISFTQSWGVWFRNFIFSSTAGTRGHGLHAKTTGDSTGVALQNCIIDGCNVGIFANFNADWDFQGLLIMASEIKNCVSHGIQNSGVTFVFGSFIHANGGSGVLLSGGDSIKAVVIQSSVIYSNAVSGFVDNNGQIEYCSFLNSSFSTNTGAGVVFTPSNVGIITNCIFDANTTYGIDNGGASDSFGMAQYNNAFYNNTTAPRRGIAAGINDITLSGSPYTSVGTDFSLNNTSGAGAAARAAGYPGVLIAGGTGFIDVGALQSQSAGSTTIVIGRNVTNYLGEQGDF